MGDGDGPELGAIRYCVYRDPEGRHWVGRVELVGWTPKRTLCRWRDLDTVEKRTYTAKADEGSATRDGAIDRYQVAAVMSASFRGQEFARDAVRRVLDSERLRGVNDERSEAQHA